MFRKSGMSLYSISVILELVRAGMKSGMSLYIISVILELVGAGMKGQRGSWDSLASRLINSVFSERL